MELESNTNLCKKALEYATKKHKGQYRKGLSHKEYIVHPISVCNLVEKYMMDDEDKQIYKAAALLHDTLENTSATKEELEEIFGEDISNIVSSLTSNKSLQKAVGKDIYLSNKMLKMDDNTLTIKLCDRLDNVRGLSEVDDFFNEKYICETTYIINYLLLYKELNETNLRIINDIMKEIKNVSRKSPMLIKPKKLINKIG